jgi:lipoprotein-anchoring transpeptidase ErfK/SrfK
MLAAEDGSGPRAQTPEIVTACRRARYSLVGGGPVRYAHRNFQAGNPDRDWMLSRLIWLAGLEVGKNCGGDVDTFARYIYIHGTPDSEPVGEPRSHGCIRMRNADVIALFDMVDAGTLVRIDE